MGISTEFMVLYGRRYTTWDDDWYEALEEYNEALVSPPKDAFYKWAVMDYMSGESFYIGKLIGKSPDMRWDTPCLDVVIDPKQLPEIKEQYILEFRKQFPQFEYLLEDEWSVYAFTHFS